MKKRKERILDVLVVAANTVHTNGSVTINFTDSQGNMYYWYTGVRQYDDIKPGTICTVEFSFTDSSGPYLPWTDSVGRRHCTIKNVKVIPK